ncbi:MAG: ZIP family metal transporter [Candidatus Micrarchaeia archaeon]
MNELLLVVVSSIIVSIVSLVGILTLHVKEDLINGIIFVMVAFSAGALLGGSFFHMLPEALEKAGATLVFIYLLTGFILFFILERILRWRHCHEGKCDVHAFTYLNLIGDGLHNFIDGLVIGVAYVTSVQLGIITTFLVVVHEVPQELGDFAVLVYGGFTKFRALSFNLLSALTAIIGALFGYYLSAGVEGFTLFLLPFTAGGFIYIASSDLIPELHREHDIKRSLTAFLFFIIGLILMLAFKLLFEAH